MDRVFIIAEAGANHNRNFDQAKALIEVAIEAGADAVKFQTYSSETLYSKSAPDFAGYKDINKLIKDIELPREWQKGLKQHCDDLGIEFMSTPFDEQAVEELVGLGVERLKIAGFESTDPRFVKMVASTGLPLIITAGIGSNIEMVKSIVEWVTDVNPLPDITILHGNNAYPTPYRDAGLNQIDKIRATVPTVKVGLSDHTRGILVPPLAVAKGATTIEKHFTLSRRLPGPDHPFAVEPKELNRMVEQIRLAERVCQEKETQFTHSEEEFKKGMRSVIAMRRLEAGTVLTLDDITTKRPNYEGAVAAIDYYKIIGKTVAKNVEEDEVLLWEHLS